uniref:Reverse transcriptase domain-containing protein n=1 Tax=Tanacetum cinerariifolium TaxID=118510 RepID=A0A6L2L039_TANCI|nr:hypothetical protein [Tanacetum cinerariifolium]
MVNVIPPDHVDDVPVVKPNQHDDVPIVPEPVLVDEDEESKEEEFKEEEDPQEEEDDMKVNIKEYKNELELTYPYEEVDPLNPSSPASNDGLFPGLMRRNINSLFGQMASLSRRLCGRETAHALKGKAKDKYYGKLILDLGNEVRSSVEQGMVAMEKLVEKLGNGEDKVECKKLKKELEEARFSNTFLHRQNERVERDLYWTRVRAHEFYQEMIRRGFVFEKDLMKLLMFQSRMRSVLQKNQKRNHLSSLVSIVNVDTDITVEPARQANVRNDTRESGQVRGAVELKRWFEKTESVFRISECAEGKKRFNELALMYLRMVEPERVKVDAYILGLTDNIKGEVTSSKPANLNEAIRMAHKLMKQKSQARDERILEGKKQK